MEPERWRRLQELFAAAADLAPHERDAFLDGACGADRELRAEVESLLGAGERAGATLERAVAHVAHEALPEASAETAVDAAGFESLHAGDRVGPYEVVREVGRGGMGTVYLAVRADDVWRKSVAIKIVRGGLGSRVLRDRFVHERRILARLEHPYIARVLDGGETQQGLPWLAMEFVEGMPLDQYCEAQGLAVAERLTLFERVCEAVQYAHRNLVVHRDLKPGNVLVQTDGTPRLLDFGIARLLDAETSVEAPLTVPGSAPMTPPYASPEQVRGEPVTTASDVWSLGVMLYELLAGCSPYRVANAPPRAIERAIVERDPPPPSVAVADAPATGGAAASAAERRRRARALAGDLDAIVMKALRKEPDARYGSVAALAEDSRRHREGLPVEARRGTWRYRSGRFVRRHRARVASAAVVTLVLIGSAVALALQAARLAAERDRANEEAQTSREVVDFMAGIFEVSNPEEGRADEVTARELLDRGAQRIREELRDTPLVRARMLAAIGTAYRSLGLYDSASARLGEALELRERELGQEHPDYAASMHQRALLHLDRGRLAEARADYERTIAIRERVLGAEHPDLAMSLFELGVVRARQDAPDTARTLAERALAMFERTRGPDHKDVALALMSLALLDARAERYDSADSLLQRVLAIRERAFGPEHPRVGEVLNNLGTLAARRGDNATARVHLERAHGLFERSMGPEHPQTLGALANLAAVTRRTGDLLRARRLQERCLELEERALGPDHLNIATDCINLSRTMLDLADTTVALTLLQRAHRVLTRTHGTAHAGVARVEVDMAELLVLRGRPREARRLAEGARATFTALGRESDPAFEQAMTVIEASGGR